MPPPPELAVDPPLFQRNQHSRVKVAVPNPGAAPITTREFVPSNETAAVVATLHESVVHVFPSAQAESSTQQFGTSVCVHPVTASQASTVHGAPSSQAAVLFKWTHAPAALHESSVHESESLQLAFAPPSFNDPSQLRSIDF